MDIKRFFADVEQLSGVRILVLNSKPMDSDIRTGNYWTWYADLVVADTRCGALVADYHKPEDWVKSVLELQSANK